MEKFFSEKFQITRPNSIKFEINVVLYVYSADFNDTVCS